LPLYLEPILIGLLLSFIPHYKSSSTIPYIFSLIGLFLGMGAGHISVFGGDLAIPSNRFLFILFIFFGVSLSLLLNYRNYSNAQKKKIYTLIPLINILVIVFFLLSIFNTFCWFNHKYCVINKAIEKNNLELCKDIGTECYASFAFHKHDADYCGYIQNVEEKDECFRNLSATWNELSICKKITSNNVKSSCCRGIYGLNLNNHQLSQQQRDSCEVTYDEYYDGLRLPSPEQ
jgi:hypothetical protein